MIKLFVGSHDDHVIEGTGDEVVLFTDKLVALLDPLYTGTIEQFENGIEITLVPKGH